MFIPNNGLLLLFLDVDEETIDARKGDCISDGQELEQAFQLVKNL